MTESHGWRDVTVTILVLALAIITMTGIWWQVAPHAPGWLDRYYPLTSGVSLSYRITHPDGRTSYQSTNMEQLPPTDVINVLDAASFGGLMELLGQDVNNFDVTAAQAALIRERFARVVDVEYQPRGPFTRTTTIYLVRPTAIGALKADNVSFSPPLPVFADLPAVNATQIAQGMINDVVPYTSTLTLEARESIVTPVGPLKDCLRVRSTIAIPGYEAFTVSWHCPGVGIARQQSGDTLTPGIKQYEIIAVSTASRAAHSGIPAPLQNMHGQVGRVFDHDRVAALTLLWSFAEGRTNSGITTVVVPGTDMLVYGTQNGGIVAVERARPALLWRFQTGSAVYGAPVIANGLVYAASSDRRLYALDAASGAFRWAFAADDALSGSPAFADDVVIVASEDRHVYALDARSGSEKWRFKTGGAIAATPVIADGVVYIGSDDGAFYALDLTDGRPRWVFVTGGAITAPAAVADGIVYVGSHDQTLYALKAQPEARTGEVIWSSDVNAEMITEPVIGDGSVYLALRNDLQALEATTGSERWTHRSQSRLYGAPLKIGPLILVRREHDVLAVEASSGREQTFAATSAAPAFAGLSSDGQQIFVGHFDGLLQVFGFQGSSR